MIIFLESKSEIPSICLLDLTMNSKFDSRLIFVHIGVYSSLKHLLQLHLKNFVVWKIFCLTEAGSEVSA